VSRKLPGGLEVTDVVVGKGKKAKSGKVVSMLYRGQLTNGTVFDKAQDPKHPFTFRLGT
jgi:FKBP-type peptidyl-prolyl cis-trans isomerase